MNRELSDKIKEVAELAVTKKEFIIASILFGVAGAYVIDEGRELQPAVIDYCKKISQQGNEDTSFPSEL